MATARSTVRLDPIEKDIALILGEELSPDAQVQQLRATAQQALAEGEATNKAALGYVPTHDTFVDGAQRTDLSGVKANSIVAFEFHLLLDVIQYVDEQLIIHSPLGTRSKPEGSRYNASHVWFADGVEFTDPSNPPPAEQYAVLNAQPYARKIERGLSPQAPDGVYQGVATLAKRRYGNVAYVGFGYRSLPAGAVGAWAQTASAAALARRVRGGRPDRHSDWLTRQPAIIIDPGR
ncbi:hypothetical protein CTI14_00310 [Methylobacterium radiotolerans]|nr:hypothetical protein CTI14_00310 [Methylobacterium radiotolerans]